MSTATFVPGKTYMMKFIGDSDLQVPYTCTARTKKRATFVKGSETFTRSVKVFMGSEYVLYWSYSMSSSIKASSVQD